MKVRAILHPGVTLLNMTKLMKVTAAKVKIKFAQQELVTGFKFLLEVKILI